MINNYINKLVLKLIFFKNLKKNNNYIPKFNSILYNVNEINSNNFKNIIIIKNKNIFYFLNKNLLNYRFFIFFYILIFFLKSFIIKRLITYNSIYKNFLFKQKNLINMLFFNLFSKKKLFFFKKFNKNYISKKKKYKNLLNIKLLRIKTNKKNNFIFSNFNSYFLNFSSKKKIKIKTIKKTLFNKIIKFKKVEPIFFNSFLIKSNKSIFLNSSNFFKMFLTLNNFKATNTFFKKFKKKKRYKNRFFDNNFNIKKKFIVIQKKTIFYKFKPLFLNFLLNLNLTFYNSKKLFFYSLCYFFKFNFFFIYKVKSIYLKKNFYKKSFKKFSTRFNYNFFVNACKNIIFIDNFYNNPFTKNNKFNQKTLKFIYNIYNLNSLKILNNFKFPKLKNLNNFYYFNNFYPVFYCTNSGSKRFFSKFKLNFNINYLSYIQFYILGFLENFFKRKILLKLTNNFFKKTGNFKFLNSIFLENRNYQPRYMKGFYICDFIEILWYSFFLKDLTLISDWLCKFLESSHFRFHRKFILFLQNFMNKHSHTFINILGIKGFFFDIRGKVGVAGNSKKRHYFFKFGELNRSTKSNKINFNQSVVRTPSGALGLTLIINY